MPVSTTRRVFGKSSRSIRVDQSQAMPPAPKALAFKRRFAVVVDGEIILQTNHQSVATKCWEKSGPSATILERKCGTRAQERRRIARRMKMLMQADLPINPLAEKLRERHQDTVDLLHELLGENIYITRPDGIKTENKTGTKFVNRTATDREAATGEIKVDIEDFPCDFRRDIPTQVLAGLERIRAELTANIDRVKRAVKRGELPCPKLLYWQVVKPDGSAERCPTGGVAHSRAREYGEGAQAVPVYQSAKG